MGTDTVFRMIAVRAARQLELRGAIDLTKPMDTDFQQEFASADSAKAALAAVDRFINSDRFLGQAAHRPLLDALVGAGAAFAAGVDPIPAQALNDYFRSLPEDIRKTLRSLDTVEPVVADSLIAAAHAGSDAAMCRDLQTAMRHVRIAKRVTAGQAAPLAMTAAPVVLPPLPAATTSNPIRPAGVGDLLIVQQKLIGYERTEIAYIENVMASEVRSRTHRKLDRLTQTYTTETESTSETTRDLQTSERSELSSEVSRNISEEMSLALGTQVSASYGPVLSIDASADFTYATSREEASSLSSNFSQEMIDRSVSTLTERRKETSSTETLAETEETNTHSFENNKEGATHIVGVYRWLDQRWKAQIFNYGRRLMMEFYVPEPAAIWRYAQDGAEAVETVLEEPPEFDISPADISEDPASAKHYATLAKKFGATDLDPPPDLEIAVSTSVAIPETEHGVLKGDDYNVKTYQSSVAVPDGYAATYVSVRSSKGTFIKDKNDRPASFDMQVASLEMNMMDGVGEGSLVGIRGALSIAAFLSDITAASAGIRITCTRTAEAYAGWQLATWEQLRAASKQAHDAYEAELASATNAATLGAIELSPDQKREVERTELKRGSLNLLMNSSFGVLDPVKRTGPNNPLPEIDVAVALDHGTYLSFFEQAFEWTQMTYLFYPYFWGDKDDWTDLLTSVDPDPAFDAFLKAGSSRVQIPVRPGFERAVLHYLETGEIWGGRDAPIIGSPLYVPIVAEIAESLDQSLDDAEPYGDPWEFTMPTSLVVLETDSSIIAQA